MLRSLVLVGLTLLFLGVALGSFLAQEAGPWIEAELDRRVRVALEEAFPHSVRLGFVTWENYSRVVQVHGFELRDPLRSSRPLLALDHLRIEVLGSWRDPWLKIRASGASLDLREVSPGRWNLAPLFEGARPYRLDRFPIQIFEGGKGELRIHPLEGSGPLEFLVERVSMGPRASLHDPWPIRAEIGGRGRSKINLLGEAHVPLRLGTQIRLELKDFDPLPLAGPLLPEFQMEGLWSGVLDFRSQERESQLEGKVSCPNWVVEPRGDPSQTWRAQLRDFEIEGKSSRHQKDFRLRWKGTSFQDPQVFPSGVELPGLEMPFHWKRGGDTTWGPSLRLAQATLDDRSWSLGRGRLAPGRFQAEVEIEGLQLARDLPPLPWASEGKLRVQARFEGDRRDPEIQLEIESPRTHFRFAPGTEAWFEEARSSWSREKLGAPWSVQLRAPRSGLLSNPGGRPTTLSLRDLEAEATWSGRVDATPIQIERVEAQLERQGQASLVGSWTPRRSGFDVRFTDVPGEILHPYVPILEPLTGPASGSASIQIHPGGETGGQVHLSMPRFEIASSPLPWTIPGESLEAGLHWDFADRTRRFVMEKATATIWGGSTELAFETLFPRQAPAKTRGKLEVQNLELSQFRSPGTPTNRAPLEGLAEASLDFQIDSSWKLRGELKSERSRVRLTRQGKILELEAKRWKLPFQLSPKEWVLGPGEAEIPPGTLQARLRRTEGSQGTQVVLGIEADRIPIHPIFHALAPDFAPARGAFEGRLLLEGKEEDPSSIRGHLVTTAAFAFEDHPKLEALAKSYQLQGLSHLRMDRAHMEGMFDRGIFRSRALEFQGSPGRMVGSLVWDSTVDDLEASFRLSLERSLLGTSHKLATMLDGGRYFDLRLDLDGPLLDPTARFRTPKILQGAALTGAIFFSPLGSTLAIASGVKNLFRRRRRARVHLPELLSVPGEVSRLLEVPSPSLPSRDFAAEILEKLKAPPPESDPEAAPEAREEPSGPSHGEPAN